MDVSFVNAYVSAVQNVFRTMIGIEVSIGKPSLKHEALTVADITGVMGFGGDKKGTFCISLSKESAVFIYKTMIGDEADDINADVVDAMGELTNIISGQTRVEIEKLGHKLNATLPTVIKGQNVEIAFITKVPVVTVPFTFALPDGGEGKMYLDFSFE
jgi:chemotaxis protein CheX